MEILNNSEKKVLSLLEKNCRMPAREIARRVHLSPEGVLKVMKRLEERKIIKGYGIRLNYSKLGYKGFNVMVKLIKANSQISKMVDELVKKHNSCVWNVFCEGEYDLLMDFRVKDEKDLEDMKKTMADISGFILEKEVAIILKSSDMSKVFIEQREISKFFTAISYQDVNENITDKEHELIELLRTNSRETILNLSKKLKLNPKTITSMVKNLEKRGVIEGYKTNIDVALLNYQPCIALISLANNQEGDLKRFFAYCQYTPGINHIIRQIGKYDLEVNFIVNNVLDFYNMIDNIRDKFPFVRKVTTLVTEKI